MLSTCLRRLRGGYEGKPSIFDNISTDDLIMAFFPCIRFTNKMILWFKGDSWQQKNFSCKEKLEDCLRLHNELNILYSLITKLAIICLNRNIRLVLENPYSEHHYLTRYWCLDALIIDKNRRENGDYYKKPTQYWFVGFEPKQNLVFEPIEWVEQKHIDGLWGQNKDDVIERSMIHPQYANRFIRQYLIDEKGE